jgi:tetratricopeptide (TPR) repeat protein
MGHKKKKKKRRKARSSPRNKLSSKRRSSDIHANRSLPSMKKGGLTTSASVTEPPGGVSENFPDPRPGVLPRKPNLSVCMIVRDEEKVLTRCLKSVQPVADELIVVDTGSTDRTISVAKDFGANIFHFEWCDDFSAARNESLRHATGDWILQIDADEALVAKSIPHLKRCIGKSSVLSYIVRCDNGPGCDALRYGWFTRLFRNHPRLRYERSYHEQVSDSVEDLLALDPRWQKRQEPRVVIRHYGYDRHLMRKKHERGLRIMQSYLETNPNDYFILNRLGAACCTLERYAEAETYLKKALKINPNWAETHYTLGLTLHKQNQFDSAIEYYKKALACDPGLAEAYLNLGAIYVGQGMSEDGIVVLKKALARDPDLASAHIHLGLAYQNLGMPDESIAELKKAIAINPDVSEAFLILGKAYHMKGMLNKAIGHYKRALKLDEDSPDALFNLGVAYRGKGMLDEAVAEYEKAVTLKPDHAEAHNNLAVTYYIMKKYDRAVEHCDKALELGFQVHVQFLQDLEVYR